MMMTQVSMTLTPSPQGREVQSLANTPTGSYRAGAARTRRRYTARHPVAEAGAALRLVIN